ICTRRPTAAMRLAWLTYTVPNSAARSKITPQPKAAWASVRALSRLSCSLVCRAIIVFMFASVQVCKCASVQVSEWASGRVRIYLHTCHTQTCLLLLNYSQPGAAAAAVLGNFLG